MKLKDFVKKFVCCECFYIVRVDVSDDSVDINRNLVKRGEHYTYTLLLDGVDVSNSIVKYVCSGSDGVLRICL